jgi:prevent-host-death family protein
MLVTATQLKNNLGKYLALVEDEDLIITRNGQEVAKLASIRADRVESARALFGMLSDEPLGHAREQRMGRYESAD